MNVSYISLYINNINKTTNKYYNYSSDSKLDSDDLIFNLVKCAIFIYLSLERKKTTTMKKLIFLRGAHANESQYVKYCGMEETTKQLKLRLKLIVDSNNVKKGTCKVCQKVAESMEHMFFYRTVSHSSV